MRIIRFRRRFHNPVLRTLDRVVGPARQQISRVHDDGAWDGRCVHPCALWGADLQAAASVLEEEGYGACNEVRKTTVECKQELKGEDEP